MWWTRENICDEFVILSNLFRHYHACFILREQLYYGLKNKRKSFESFTIIFNVDFSIFHVNDCWLGNFLFWCGKLNKEALYKLLKEYFFGQQQ